MCPCRRLAGWLAWTKRSGVNDLTSPDRTQLGEPGEARGDELAWPWIDSDDPDYNSIPNPKQMVP